MPLISVIVPVYNHADALVSTAKSIIGQTYRPLEIIIVNDGSTDAFGAAGEEVQRLGKLAGVDTKIIQQANSGGAAARNRGFGASQGEFVIFWDADTVAVPAMLARMADRLAAVPSASYVYSRFKVGWKTMRLQPFNPDDLRRVNYIDTTSLIRRDAFAGFDESLRRFQDWDLWLTLLDTNKTGSFISEVLFTKKVTRPGISRWLPSVAYRLPWKLPAVTAYREARRVIAQKHHLPPEDSAM